MKYITKHVNSKLLDWNGKHITVFDKMYRTRFNFIEKYSKYPESMVMNAKNYREILMDNAMIRFGKTPNSLGEPIQVFGVKIRISNHLPDDIMVAHNEPKIYGPKYGSDMADAFLYATMEAAK